MDYGATFANLAASNDATLRSRAQAFDRRREEEQAARDSLMFERYEQGVISGQEILAYIRSRINQTSYDKAQQRQWREAYIQYSAAVADNAAETEYAETGNIHALISHYADRLRGVKSGTPEATELAQRLRSLRQQRDSDSLERGARRIARRIQRGDASTKDLIEFYKDQLTRLPGNSPLRQQVLDALAQARSARRDEMLNVALQKLDTKLDTGSITPQQAANRKKAIIDRFGLQSSDPVAYWKFMDEINQLRATPDPAELNKLYTLVQSGQMSFSKFQDKLLQYADLIAPYDNAAAWELRNTAIMGIEGATPLENPGELGNIRGASNASKELGNIRGASNASKVIAHISQLDGSKYSQFNCTMAASAMLAHAMGVTDLSGGDLRYLSGVTTDATNIQQAQYALQKAGVKGTRLSWQNRIAFEKFKKRVANGAPAVLSGWNGDIPQQFNSSGIIGGHAMFVAGYDRKRDAFLMLDPAKSKDSGTWWPANVVEGFGWGGERFGQALFAPRGTINPSTLRNWKGAKTIHVSVDAPPRRPETPSNYRGQFNPGPSNANSVTKAIARQEARKRRQRAKDAGIEGDIQTEQEALREIDRFTKTLVDNQAIIDAYSYEKSLEPGEDAFSITIGGDTRTWTGDDIRALTEESLFSLDGQEILLKAMGQFDRADGVRRAKLDLVKSNAELNTISHDYAENRLMMEVASGIEQAEMSNDPSKVFDVLEQLIEGYTAINEMDQGDQTDQQQSEDGSPPPPPTSTTEVQQQVDQLDTALTPQETFEYGSADQLLESLSDFEMDSDTRIDLFLQWAEANDIKVPKGWLDGKPPEASEQGTIGDTWARIVTGVNAASEVSRGEAAYVVQGGGITTLPTVVDAGVQVGGGRSEQTVPAEAQTQQGEQMQGDVVTGAGTMLDISGLDLDYTHSDFLPRVAVKIDGVTTVIPAVPEREPYPGVNFLKATSATALEEFGVKPDGDRDFYLTQDEIAQLEAQSPGLTQTLIQRGALESVPFSVQTIQMPTWVDQNGSVQLGAKWFQDPGTQRWSEGGLPFISSSEDPTGLTSRIGAGYVGIDPDNSSFGNPMPALELDPDLMDQGTTGVIAPFQPNIAKGVLEMKLQNGELGVDYGMDRDPNGDIISDNAAQHAGMYTNIRPMTSVVKQYLDKVTAYTQGAVNEAQAGIEQPNSNPLSDILQGAANVLGDLHSLAQTNSGQQGVLDFPEPQRVQTETTVEEASPLPMIGQQRQDVIDPKDRLTSRGITPLKKDKPKEPKLPKPQGPRPLTSGGSEAARAKNISVTLPKATTTTTKKTTSQKAPMKARRTGTTTKKKTPVSQTENWQNTQGQIGGR